MQTTKYNVQDQQTALPIEQSNWERKFSRGNQSDGRRKKRALHIRCLSWELKITSCIKYRGVCNLYSDCIYMATCAFVNARSTARSQLRLSSCMLSCRSWPKIARLWKMNQHSCTWRRRRNEASIYRYCIFFSSCLCFLFLELGKQFSSKCAESWLNWVRPQTY